MSPREVVAAPLVVKKVLYPEPGWYTQYYSAEQENFEGLVARGLTIVFRLSSPVIQGSIVANKRKRAPEKKTLNERAFERLDLNREIHLLEKMIEGLRLDYEQFFLGVAMYMPDKLHRLVKMQIRKLQKAPFKRSEHNYRIRALESRYNTYNDYWQRTIRQKEEGTYHKDVFKAKMRELHAKEDAAAGTAKGAASKQVTDLFNSYKQELEKATGKKQNVDFAKFQKSLLQQAKAFKKQHKDKNLAFKVVVRDGKVAVKARAVERKRKS